MKAIKTETKANHFNGAVKTLRAIYKRGTKKVGYNRRQFLADCVAKGVKKTTAGKHWLLLGGVRKAASLLDDSFVCAEFSIN